MWTSLETPGLNNERTADVLKEVQKLWVEKKYAQCARTAENYLRYVPDHRISFYAANAYTEIALGLPAAKALPNFERAAYYFAHSDNNLNFECDNLSICISRLGMVPDSWDTRAALGRAAIERGDLQAAYAELSKSRDGEAITMAERIRGFLNWKIDFDSTYIPDPLIKESVKPLEKILALEEEAAGKNSDILIPTLTSLATTYRLSGNYEKAIDAYQETFRTWTTHVSRSIGVCRSSVQSRTQCRSAKIYGKGSWTNRKIRQLHSSGCSIAQSVCGRQPEAAIARHAHSYDEVQRATAIDCDG